MKPRQLLRSTTWLPAIFIVMLTLSDSAQAAVHKYDVLYPFQGGTDGSQPTGSLIVDASGNLYGSTAEGGSGPCQMNQQVVGCGTVFELSPPAGKNKFWTKTLLYDFQGPDGNSPSALIADSAGNLYGVTEFGGSGQCSVYQIPGCGIVFELSPTAGGAWTETILYNFQGGSDGTLPFRSLVRDSAGNLYSVTMLSYQSSPGVVFELSPPAAGDGQWTESVLFSGYGDKVPIDIYANLILDAKGNLYSTSVFGGTSDAGTVFELRRPPTKDGVWTEINLYSFDSQEDNGDGPVSPVIFDSKGNLYGTLFAGGLWGEVFQLSPPRKKGGAWTENVLYSFGGGTKGLNPFSGLIFDQNGNLYGNTFGDDGIDPVVFGTVYKLTQHSDGSWGENLLHEFLDQPAEFPVGELVFGSKGELYGATAAGDSSAPGGVVFRISFGMDR
jgi:hypothetical protein